MKPVFQAETLPLIPPVYRQNVKFSDGSEGRLQLRKGQDGPEIQVDILKNGERIHSLIDMTERLEGAFEVETPDAIYIAAVPPAMELTSDAEADAELSFAM